MTDFKWKDTSNMDRDELVSEIKELQLVIQRTDKLRESNLSLYETAHKERSRLQKECDELKIKLAYAKMRWARAEDKVGVVG